MAETSDTAIATEAHPYGCTDLHRVRDAFPASRRSLLAGAGHTVAAGVILALPTAAAATHDPIIDLIEAREAALEEANRPDMPDNHGYDEMIAAEEALFGQVPITAAGALQALGMLVTELKETVDDCHGTDLMIALAEGTMRFLEAEA